VRERPLSTVFGKTHTATSVADNSAPRRPHVRIRADRAHVVELNQIKRIAAIAGIVSTLASSLQRHSLEQ
jgi:hypothetical protein